MKNPLDNTANLWYNKYSQEGEANSDRALEKIFQRNLKNPLDKSSNLWYNKYVSERDKLHYKYSLAATKRLKNLVANNILKEVDTMATEKMTKRDYINRILTYAHDEDKEFLTHELELLDKRNAAERKPTARQTENAGFKEDILAYMEPSVVYTAAEIQKGVPSIVAAGLTINRVSAMLTQLVTAKVIDRKEEKGKRYYSLPQS